MIYINGEAISPILVDDSELQEAYAEIIGEVGEEEEANE